MSAIVEIGLKTQTLKKCELFPKIGFSYISKRLKMPNVIKYISCITNTYINEHTLNRSIYVNSNSTFLRNRNLFEDQRNSRLRQKNSLRLWGERPDGHLLKRHFGSSVAIWLRN